VNHSYLLFVSYQLYRQNIRLEIRRAYYKHEIFHFHPTAGPKTPKKFGR